MVHDGPFKRAQRILVKGSGGKVERCVEPAGPGGPWVPGYKLWPVWSCVSDSEWGSDRWDLGCVENMKLGVGCRGRPERQSEEGFGSPLSRAWDQAAASGCQRLELGPHLPTSP